MARHRRRRKETPLQDRPHSELGLATRHAVVSLIGFSVDFAVLHGSMRCGLEPAWARVISLACAVHATFVLNGVYVFKRLSFERGLLRCWAAYLTANAFGNLCNYWFFVTLVSLHHAVLSRPAFALCLASLGAWGINYAGSRLLVFGGALGRRFGGPRRRLEARPRLRAVLSPTEPGSSRR